MSERGKYLKEGPKCKKEGNSDCYHRSSNPHILHLAMQTVWWASLVLTPFLCLLACLSPIHLTFKLGDVLVQLKTISYMTAFLSVFLQSGSLLKGPDK